MGINKRIRSVFVILFLLGSVAAGFLYWQSTQTEKAYVFAADFKQFTFIQNSTEDFLLMVDVPKNRDFTAITDPNQIVGMYTAREMVSNTLVQEGLLIHELPTGQRQFERGLLPVNSRAYPIDIPSNIAGTFQLDDLLDVYMIINTDGEASPDDRGVVLYQKVTFLGEEGGQYLVALSPEQIMAYEGWKLVEGTSFTAAITQPANGDYAPLSELLMFPDYQQPEARDLFAPPIPTPDPVTAEEQTTGETEIPVSGTEGGE